MATKFITIRIPIPTLNWFKKEEVVYEPQQDVFARTAEIKARIAALRSRLGKSEQPTKVTQAPSEPVVAQEPQQSTRAADNKAKELDAIKAKLMRKKI